MNVQQSFIAEIKGIIKSARGKAYAAVNFAMVEAYWQIGRHIAIEEQHGAERAGYGDYLIKELSRQLSGEFGSGFSQVSLKNYRKFYLVFSQMPIGHTPSAQLQITDNELVEKRQTVSAQSYPSFLRRELTWSHYQLIMRLENKNAIKYYIDEAADNNWSVRTLQRNINTFYYERLLSSKSPKEDILKSASFEKQSPEDFIKDPYIFEFLNIAEPKAVGEYNIETALIDNLQQFLLELGKGFSFVKRQYRINTETKSFSIDLVFYNFLLKCFVLFDLKTSELTHQDVGQMDMYVRMFDELQRTESDNPTIGIILCTHKDETIVKFSVLNGNEQLFATKYKLYLPTEEELIKEIEREKFIIEQYFKNKE
jgi:predicted nuclease of restriction endonuclease-like (RecB) superfamily